MRFTPTALGGAALLCLLSAAAARADFVQWTYNWSRSPAKVFADGSTTSYITLTDESQHVATGDSDIVATNLHTFSDAPTSNPAHFTHKGYTLTLTLTDLASAKVGALTFTGEFNGDLSARSANITTIFTGQTMQTLILGDHKYTVVLNQYSAPGPPSQNNNGSIASHIQTFITISNLTPEPPAAALAGLGALPLLGFAAWRRGRGKK
jgi:hypothetical protein